MGVNHKRGACVFTPPPRSTFRLASIETPCVEGDPPRVMAEPCFQHGGGCLRVLLFVKQQDNAFSMRRVRRNNGFGHRTLPRAATGQTTSTRLPRTP